MNIRHWVKKEDSGLFKCMMELAKYEKRAGHAIVVKYPGDDTPLAGIDRDMQVDLIHSQLYHGAYQNGLPKFMWMHGEPLGSVGNGISMRAIVDLAPICAGFICMRTDEHAIWKSIKPQTYLVSKGIDLEVYKPLEDVTEKLSGEPSVLYYENWRNQRNPLYLCLAMAEVHKKLPKARLHLYNCPDQRMLDTFKKLHDHNHWWPFLRSIQGKAPDVNKLLNQADIIVSCLHPLYARSIEAFGAGKAFIGPGYKEHDYPWQCDLDPQSMADTIVKCWTDYQKVDYRDWARRWHNVEDTVKESISIYQRFL